MHRPSQARLDSQGLYTDAGCHIMQILNANYTDNEYIEEAISMSPVLRST